MKAGFFRKFWIMLMSAKQILAIALKAIYYGKIGQPEKMDKIIHQDSFKFLDLVSPEIQIFGDENIHVEPNKRYMIMCNHSSHYDIPLSFMTFKGLPVKMIAKKELYKIPIFGSAMHHFKTVRIDRSNLKQAIKDLECAKQRMEEGLIIWISPEGSRLRTGKKKPLKKGGFITAIDAKATIIPMYIQGADKVLPAKTWDFYLGKKINISVMPHIEASEYTKENMGDLMDRIESVWAEAEEAHSV